MDDLTGSDAPLRRPFWEQSQGALIVAILALLLLLSALGLSRHWYRQYLLRESRAEVEADIAVRGIALTAVMNRRFALLDGLAAFVETDQETDDFEDRFETYAEKIGSSRLGIRNIAIAPDGVIRNVYPREGNEQVVGYNPLQDPRGEIRRDVEQALETREIILTGPIELLQGGWGLIARKAIYQDDVYWGLVSIVLDTDMILTRAGLNQDPIGNLDLALYTGDGVYLTGSPGIKNQYPVNQIILLPGEEWVLAGVPSEGWEAAIRPNIQLFQGLGLAIVALITCLVYLSFNRQAYLSRAVQHRTSEISSMYAQLQEDLAKRMRTEKALEEQKEQYRSVFEMVQDGLFIHDLEGNLVGFNRAAHEMFGYSGEEFSTLRPDQYIGPGSNQLFDTYLRSVREGQQYRGKAITRKKDGSPMDYEVRGTPFSYQGTPHALAVVRDITEQVQAYHLLEQRVSERTRDVMTLMQVSQNLVSTLELEPLLEMILDQLQSIVDYNGAAVFTLQDGFLSARAYRGPLRKPLVLQTSFRLSESLIDQAIYQKLEPLIIPDVLTDDPLAAAMRQNLERVSATAEPSFRSWLGVPLIYKGKYIGNLTFDHQEPDFYQDYHAQLAQAFANQAAIAIENARLYEQVGVLASLQERQRLARELHDSVSQALYGIALGVRTAKTLLDELPTEHDVKGTLNEPLNYIAMLVEAGLAEMRALIFELRPESLAEEGLICALNKQAAAVQARYHLQVITCLGVEPEVELDTKHALYRIAQEALHNAVKHAQASKVALCLIHEKQRLILVVEDDGIGFDSQKEYPGHLGLRSMRERAERLGGSFRVETAIGKGTRISVDIPLKMVDLGALPFQQPVPIH